MTLTMTAEVAAALRQPFNPDEIGKLPRIWCASCRTAQFKCCEKHTRRRCGDCNNNITEAHLHLDYVGHAEITDRLLQADPGWSWEPVAFDPNGLPLFDGNGGLWMRLTVAGVTRLGYGSADGKKGPDAIKEVIGDGLRNAAMRFGVALDLWGAKFEAAVQEREEPATEPAAEPAAAAPRPAPNPGDVRDWALERNPTAKDLRLAADKLRAEHPTVAAAKVENEHGDAEDLAALLVRRADELTGPAATPEQDDVDRKRREKRLFALLRDLGYENNRPARLQVYAKILDREVGSTKDLSLADIEVVIKACEVRKAARARSEAPTDARELVDA